jgi:multidrug transporter EmrE-like cation transporter
LDKADLSAPSITGSQDAISSSVRRSFLLVFACTVIGAAAQMLIKKGAGQLGLHVTLRQVLRDPFLVFQYGFHIVANPQLFVGYGLYGINTVLMAYALKGRELSRLYPIIALTYVWVTLLSVVMLNEHVNFFRMLGITAIVVGVSILGGGKFSRKGKA